MRHAFTVAIPLFASLALIACGGSGDGGSTGGPAPQPAFTGSTGVTVGALAQTSAVATADLNADGQLDLVVADRANDKVVVRLGAGAGFGAAVDVPVGDQPTGVVLADFDLDGDLDLAVTASGTDSLSILLNSGAGVFVAAAGAALPVGGQASAVVAGDFNGDGAIDVAVAHRNLASVSLALGNGNGTFAVAAQFAASAGFQGTGIVAGDFNSDGNLDLAASGGTSGQAAVFLGNGNGTFAASVSNSLAAGADVSGLAAGDFNLDGTIDLVLANRTTGQASILLGAGNGTFGASTSFLAGADVTAIATGDFDRDGRLDIVVTLNGTGNVALLTGNGNGTLDAAVSFSGAGTGAVALAVGDVNTDGSLDVVVAQETSGNVGVLTGTDRSISLGFGAAASLNIGLGADPSAVVRADFNADGRVDLAVTDKNNDSVAISLGLGNGSFGAASSVALAAATGPVAVASADVNGDGRLDLLVANETADNVNVLIGNGSGGFVAGASVALAAGANPSAIVSTDVNHDGNIDIVTANNGSAQISVSLGDGAGAFAAVVNLPIAAGFDSSAMVSGDFNRDGDVDLVIGSTTSGTVAVLLGDGAGSFGAAVEFVVDAGANLSGVVALDANQDGRLDLAVSNRTTGEAAILLGNGAGSFGAATEFAAALSATGLTAVDFNRDGRMDLAVTGGLAGQTAVLLGNGNGTFAAATAFAAGGSGTASIVPGDFNNDGRVDAAFANATSGNAAVILNQGL